MLPRRRPRAPGPALAPRPPLRMPPPWVGHQTPAWSMRPARQRKPLKAVPALVGPSLQNQSSPRRSMGRRQRLQGPSSQSGHGPLSHGIERIPKAEGPRASSVTLADFSLVKKKENKYVFPQHSLGPFPFPLTPYCWTRAPLQQRHVALPQELLLWPRCWKSF